MSPQEVTAQFVLSRLRNLSTNSKGRILSAINRLVCRGMKTHQETDITCCCGRSFNVVSDI